MLIETWVVIIFLAFLFLLCCICSLGWVIADQMLDDCRKQNDRMQEEIHYLRGKLIVKTANEFHNEGKKK